ncbi:MAG: CRISPR-associated endonuclease Cas2 [Firmicutes bacterium]|nr:CRISPR-associated endonuclease Cas2 [Bacillota bacterium]
MFVIMVYDVNEKRVGKALKISRKYLNWVQNSVFEGEISKAKLTKLKVEMKELINRKEDSIIFYELRSTRYTSRDIIGQEKGGDDNFL